MSACIRAQAGALHYNGTRQPRVRSRALRALYAARHGPIPRGVQLHHECGNGWCVNVEHIILVTHPQHVAMHRYKNLAAGFDETAKV